MAKFMRDLVGNHWYAIFFRFFYAQRKLEGATFTRFSHKNKLAIDLTSDSPVQQKRETEHSSNKTKHTQKKMLLCCVFVLHPLI